MSTALKDLYSPAFIDQFLPSAQRVIPEFDPNAFRKSVFNKEWPAMELKARMRHLAVCLHSFMPKNFSKASKLLIALVDELTASRMTGYGLEFMFIPDYVALYGLDDLAAANKAMERITQFSSCEFAVRPFILKYPAEMAQQMLKWSLHKDEKVRRFASEGIRPRLPWAMAIPALKKDPSPVLPILENLKNDPSAFVRKSVANNLNDISKDHPDVLLNIARKWKGNSANTDAIIKHASRTLLKSAHPGVLRYYGLHKNDAINVESFSIAAARVKWGGDLSFQFSVINTGKKTADVRLEYSLYFLRKNGQLSKKVFKISERKLAANEKITLIRKHSFRAITTRVYYPGQHEVAVVVNGKEFHKGSFLLLSK
ncbi:MAG: DNA alkylation repair protein [Chitinophagaceae bacterium]|nr:DNA alkylation repair protein [Chitinophagaceae bacterium]